MNWLKSLNESASKVYENAKQFRLLNAVGNILEAPFRLINGVRQDIADILEDTNKTRQESGGNMESTATGSAKSVKPLAILGKTPTEGSMLQETIWISNEKFNAGEIVTKEMVKKIYARRQGYMEESDNWSEYKAKRWLHYGKNVARFILPKVAFIGVAVVGAQAVVAGMAALGPLWAAQGIAGIETLSGAAGLLGYGAFATAGVAATAGLAYVANSWVYKLFTRDVARPLQAEETAGGWEALMEAGEKSGGFLHAKHAIPTGAEFTLKGDLRIGMETTVEQLGIQLNSQHVTASSLVPCVYDVNGMPYMSTFPDNKIPAGTVFPAGTQFRGASRTFIPAASTVSTAKQYSGDKLDYKTSLKESLEITNENGAVLTQPLRLSAPVRLGVVYTSEDAASQAYGMDEISPKDTIIPAGTRLPKGTRIPAGSHMGVESITEGDLDINTLDSDRLPSHVSQLRLPKPTLIRRNLHVHGEIRIPKDATSITVLQDGSMQKFTDMKQLKKHEEQGGMILYRPENNLVTAGSILPAGTMLSHRVTLERHQKTKALPVGRLKSDIICESEIDLVTVAQKFIASGEESNFRLRLADTIPADLNELPDFVDPDTGILIKKDEEIPAGTSMPVKNKSDNHMKLPADFIIPGGSEVYDVRKKPETAQILVNERIRKIILDDLMRSPAGGTSQPITSGQVKTVLLTEAKDAFDALQHVPAFTPEQIREKTKEIHDAIAKRIQQLAMKQVAKLNLTGKLTGTDSAAKKADAFTKSEVLEITILIDQIDNAAMKEEARQALDTAIDYFAQ